VANRTRPVKLFSGLKSLISGRELRRAAERDLVPENSWKSYRPGDKVPASGIYRVMHFGHGHDHYVTCIREHVFPFCRTCGDRVRFRTFHLANGIEHHNDFL
jgi:hypothetical protein